MSNRLYALSLALLLLPAGPGEAAPRCLDAKERAAVDIRIVQTELMVAALSCRAVPGRDYTGNYNAFMKAHGDRLAEYGRTLKAYFASSYGAKGEEALNAFVTSVANDASRRSMSTAGFCDNAQIIYQEAAALQPQYLESWAWVRAAVHDRSLPVCAGAEKPASAPKKR